MGQYSSKTKNYDFAVAFNTVIKRTGIKTWSDMKPKLNTCPRLDATKNLMILHLSHFGTMFDCVAKQMGVPEGQFSPLWPLSV